MGSVVEYLDQHSPGGDRRDMPSYVYLPTPLGHLQGYDYAGQYGGWLGQAYNALATNFRRRAMTAAHRDVAGRDGPPGQQRFLDLPREIDFVRQPLALDQLDLRVLEAARHLVHRARQQAELGAVSKLDGRVEVTAAHAFDSGPQHADRMQQLRHHDERRRYAEHHEQSECRGLLAP